jgi:hypothetical protein
VTLARRIRLLVPDGLELSRPPKARRDSALPDPLLPGARAKSVSRVPLRKLWIIWSMMIRLGWLLLTI